LFPNTIDSIETKVFPLFDDNAEPCDNVIATVHGHSGQPVRPQVSGRQMGQRKVMRRGGEVYWALRVKSWYVQGLLSLATH